MIKKVMTVLCQEGQKENVAFFTPHTQYVTVCEHAHIIWFRVLSVDISNNW